MNLPVVIKEIILTSRSLVVPGLGKFWIKHRPAKIDRSSNVLLPPRQIIVFDESIITDDGRLSDYLQKKYTLNEKIAAQAIADYVESLKKELEEKTTATIEGIGVLKVHENNISLQPDAIEDLLKDILPSIEIPESMQKEPLAEERVKIQAPPVKTAQPVKRSFRVWIPVTIIVLVAALAAVLYYTGIGKAMLKDIAFNKNEDIAESDDNNKIVFGKPPADKDSLQEAISKKLDERTAKENALSYKQPESEQSDNQILEPVIREKQPEPITAGSYHVIAGSFHVPGNAERYKSRLEKQGFHPVIMPNINSYYMVSLGSYQSLEQATVAMTEFSSKFDVQLWIKKI